MSEPTFAAILTIAFFAFLAVWVPFLDSVLGAFASLRRRRAVARPSPTGRDYDRSAV